jgi:hypothetical protein
MYQIKYQCGYEIQVAGRRCRVADSNNAIVLDWTTYEACLAWLADRSVRPL